MLLPDISKTSRPNKQISSLEFWYIILQIDKLDITFIG